MTTFIENELKNKRFSNNEINEKNTTYSVVLASVFSKKNITFGISFLLISSLPFMLYYCMFDKGDYGNGIVNSCLADKINRIPCGKEHITASECSNVFCCFEPSTNSCFHSEPSAYFYNYEEGLKKYLPSKSLTPLGVQSLNELQISVEETENYLKIVLNGNTNNYLEQFKNFDVRMNENGKLALTVFRKNSEKELLLSTMQGPLIVTNEYLEWTLQLNTGGEESVLFGLGQLKITLDENTTLSKIIYKNQDDHNTLPIFMAYDNYRKYHAVVLKSSGVLEIKVLPSYLIILRSISGDSLEIQVYDGPYPKDIRKKMNNGNVENIPDWALGVHLCRENYGGSVEGIVEQFEDFLGNYAKFPFDYESECIHDDLLLHILAENFTNIQVKDLFNQFNIQRKFMLSYPSQIPLYSETFEKFRDKNVFFTKGTGEIYTGLYKKMDVVYPNYRDVERVEEFLDEIKRLFDEVEINGLVFSHNWPQDDSFSNFTTNISYIDSDVRDALFNTLPFYLKEKSSIHLKFHNEDGSKVRETVKKAFGGQLFTISPTSKLGENGFLVQNVNASWVELKNALGRSLSNSLFGASLISIPVCGSTEFYDESLNENLCLRWYLLAATMPLFRISSKGINSRDPANFNTKYSAGKSVEILEKRKKLIPYFRNILIQGEPLVRPLFYNFPNENVQSLDEQYMLGDGILVAQPMSSDVHEIDVYLPPGMIWYEFWGGMKYITKKNAEIVKFPIVQSDWVSFILEGSIVSFVDGDKIELIIAENCTETCTAYGSVILNIENVDVVVGLTWINATLSLEVSKKEMHARIVEMIDKKRIYN